MSVQDALAALNEWADRYRDVIGDISTEVDTVEGEPTRGRDGRLYASFSPGDMHIRIDIPRRPEATS